MPGAVGPAAVLALQRSAGNRAVGRLLARQTTVEVAPGGCTIAQHREIEPAVRTATRWLMDSVRLLDDYIRAPDAAANASTRQALRRNFIATTAATATLVRDRFSTILTDMLTSRTLRTECHTTADASCVAANAYVQGQNFVFCPIFFDFAPLQQAMSVIHEMAHAIHPEITDRAYRSNRYYRWMTAAEARTNAESYGYLAQELGTGRPAADTAPRDTIEDCPPDWDLALARSTAIAERWARNARMACRDRRPAWLSGWDDLRTRFLGSAGTAALDQAQSVYDRAEGAFQERIDFECEPGATGGRCADSTTYWYMTGDFHVCPRWMAIPTEPGRTEALLAGFLGYKGIVDDNARRNALAGLARALNERYWPAPAS